MRIVAISDTHGLHDRLAIPECDVLVHAGDFTRSGTYDEVQAFADWFTKQPAKHKIVIPGNHDCLCEKSPTMANALIKDVDVQFLIDEHVTIDGVLFYGSPWQPEFCNWAFNLKRGAELKAKWDLIPNGVNVLITHGPPYRYLDQTSRGQLVGCEELDKVIRNRLIDLRLHVFGHIHEGYGYYRRGTNPLYVNASTCNLSYKPVNAPIVMDYQEDMVMVVTEPQQANG